jgi:hypothetical protein
MPDWQVVQHANRKNTVNPRLTLGVFLESGALSESALDELNFVRD